MLHGIIVYTCKNMYENNRGLVYLKEQPWEKEKSQSLHVLGKHNITHWVLSEWTPVKVKSSRNRGLTGRLVKCQQ